MDRLDAMQTFVRVIEKGSFSAVAKERGIGQPAVSKHISALEEELGTELIHRTSRSIALTEAGRDFYESALRILEDFENAASRIGRGQTAPKGLIRVAVPPTFARLHMVSKLPAFFATYPDLAVEMSTLKSPTTIIEDGFDLAIHSGDLPDSSLVARKLGQTMIVLVATQGALRHASITTTGNVYVQVVEDNVMRAVNSHASTVLEGWRPEVESMCQRVGT
jgi:LysR family transcriptional regulator for bpeEF and oprC